MYSGTLTVAWPLLLNQKIRPNNSKQIMSCRVPGLMPAMIPKHLTLFRAKRFPGDDLWHQVHPADYPFGARLVDGGRSRLVGKLWRRWAEGGWQYRQYKQDDPTDDELASDQW